MNHTSFLRPSIRGARSAFTILELLLVLVILAVLAGIVGSRFVGQSQSAKIKAAGTQLQNFKLALGRFEIDLGRYPTSSEGLRVLVAAVLLLGGGRWFGIGHLDGRITLAFAMVFGASALALPWLRSTAAPARA
mgnify:CR=1 FL=1